MEVQITEVSYGKDIDSFIDFPHELYKNDTNYVPEIFSEQKKMMNPDSYPFHQYGQVKYFLAKKSKKIVGRIAAIINPHYISHLGKKSAFFGFLDFIEDQEVLNRLLQAAAAFAQSHKMDYLTGPTNFTTNETAGVLVDGFHEPPKLMMTYNAPYYGPMLENCGLTPDMDLYAYAIDTSGVSLKSIELSESIERRLHNKGITIRPINIRDLDNEAQKIKDIYNQAWEANWGFVPFTNNEFEYLNNHLKDILDPRLAYIAEKDDRGIGFSITLPDYNEILIKIKKGRLFPFGIFRWLLFKNKIKNVRILALGVLKSFRKSGIESVFFAKTIQEAKRRGFRMGEASWILRDNMSMRLSVERLNGKKYKTYRIYSMKLN